MEEQMQPEGIADFGAECEKCGTINTITLEEGHPKITNFFRY
jgi:hypothetical protein